MIIQRWQSLMLLVAFAMMTCFSFVSLGQVQAADFTYDFTALGFTSEGIPTGNATVQHIGTWYLFAISLMSAILPLIAIFCFNNFRLQKSLCAISILFTIATAAVAAMLGYTAIEGGVIGWSTSAIEPLIAIVAIIIAYRMICSDQRKLRSIDRFRD